MDLLNYEDLLGGPICTANVHRIVEDVSQNPDLFDRIYQLTFHQDTKISWRATWACEKLSERYPDWFISKQSEIIKTLLACNHDGKKRLLLSILSNLPLPDPYSVALLDYVLEKMLDPKESIGVQALSIKFAYRLCQVDKDLIGELKQHLESADTDIYSAGVKSSIKNVLKKIKHEYYPD